MHTTYAGAARAASEPEGAAPRTRLATELLAAAVALGVLGEVLLRQVPWGINVPLWIGALLLTVGVAARGWGIGMRGEGARLLPLALLFAALIAWRASPALLFLNTLALLVVLALGALRARSGTLRRAGVGEYLWGLVLAGLNAAAGCLFLLLQEVRWNDVPILERTGRAAGVLRGLLIAAPLLLVFGALFAAADPVFDQLVGALWRWRAEDWAPFLVWTGFWAWLSAGYLRQVLFGVVGARAALPRSEHGKIVLGATEVATALGLLNALFLAFVLVQFRYLFGGAVLVRESVGLSYAEYARRGFFELVTVAVLVLPLLLGLHALLRGDEPRAERIFRRLAGVLITLLFVVMASAVERMRLYQSEYGLTELRFYTSAFMAWLALVFCWFAATVLRGRRERFAWGALVVGLATLGALNVLNPDALVVRTNTARAHAGARWDPEYLAGLSADAVPELLAAMPAMDPATRCRVADRVQRRWGTSRGRDWRTWNAGRERTHKFVRQHAAELRTLACPPARLRLPPT